MTHDVAALCRFLLDYLEKITGEMTPADLLAGTGGANPPGWILGHLAVVTDYVGPYLKLRRKCPAAWHKAFGSGSVPSAEMPQQTAAEWLSAIRAGYEDVLNALPTVDDAMMAEPHGAAILAGSRIETKGQLLTHIVTTNLAAHIGQLSAWRRAKGNAPLF